MFRNSIIVFLFNLLKSFSVKYYITIRLIHVFNLNFIHQTILALKFEFCFNLIIKFNLIINFFFYKTSSDIGIALFLARTISIHSFFLFFNIFKFLLLRNLANLANNFQFHFSFFDIIISYDDRWMNFLTSYIFSNFVALLSFSNLICIACSCFDVVT